MKLSEAIQKLVAELALRGDCDLVAKHGDVYIAVEGVEVYKTPYAAPEGSGYLELTLGTP